MKNGIVILLFGLVACQSGADTDPGSANETTAPLIYQTTAQVRSIAPSKSHVVVAHNDIPGYMDAMTMSIRIKDPNLVTDIAPGDSIRFELTVDGPDIYISVIEPIIK